jgi:hypothetical protein
VPQMLWHLTGFSGLIQRIGPFIRLLRHAWGCGGPILTRRWYLPKYIVQCIWVLSSNNKTDRHHITEKLLEKW